ncbi:hypothetical protein LOTGIDRAFT_230081, partial [Lottia gigantea]
MASLAGIKLDEDGNSSFATNCFPVRHFSSVDDEAGGAWYVSHRAEQRRRFKAVLCTKPRTYSRIKEERKKSELEGKSITECKLDVEEEDDEDEGPILDGFFLMKHCCVEDPSDLCSVNISGQGFTEVKEDDLVLFDNVAYVNAAENYLPFEAFRGFPILRELEVPLNGLRSLQIKPTDYITLELLDLSYNNLSQEDILLVGTLPHLKVLHLTGNGFTNIPHDLCLPFVPEGRKSQYPRFPYLEVLMLDDNKLSDINIFAAMAGLQRLKHLNLEKNQIFFVPQLKSVQGKMKPDEKLTSPRKKRKTPREGRSSRRSKSRMSSANAKQSTENITDATQQEESTEVQDHQGEVTESGAGVETKPEEIKVENEEVTEEKQEEIQTQDPLISNKNELLDEDFELSLGDLSARINDLNLEADINPRTPSTIRKPKLEPASQIAFPELRYLSLAYNQICNEEALLAVAAWPMLSELVFHDNPLTTEHVGAPPLLKRFLHDRLGIKLVRKRVAPSIKKHVQISDKPSRRVKTQVPKIPRPTVEQRLMLEAPKPPPPGLMKDEERPSTSYKSPLPPINKQQRSASAGALPRRREEADAGPSDAWSSDVGEELEADTFFMTQVDDQEEEKDSRPPTKLKPSKPLDKRYHGYEELFEGDDEAEFEEDKVSKDIQSNVRALRYALNHQLVYRDTKSLQLQSVTKPVKAYRRHPLPPSQPKPSKEEKIESILENLRNRTTVDEASLKQVLKNKKLKHKFPEAETLLAQIQHRYNAVRVTSMKEAKDARKAVQDTLSDISKRSGVKVSH